MTSKNVRLQKLWQFKLVNRFTLEMVPPVLVFGTSYRNAEDHVFARFPRSNFDVDSCMVVNNRRFMAICAAVYPDLNEVPYVQD